VYDACNLSIPIISLVLNLDKGGAHKTNKAKEKISKAVDSCKQLPGESKTDMFRRLDQNIHDAMNEAIKESKGMRKKRKE